LGSSSKSLLSLASKAERYPGVISWVGPSLDASL
jgi:hypothetical protein